MKAPGKAQLTIYVLGLVGAALFTILLIRQGAGAVGTAIATAGWGIAAVAAFSFCAAFSRCDGVVGTFSRNRSPALAEFVLDALGSAIGE